MKTVTLLTTLFISMVMNSNSRAHNEEPLFVTNEYFTFGSPDYHSVSVKLADFDQDGDLDVLLSNGRHWARQDYIFYNTGFGRFLKAHPLGELGTAYEPAIDDVNNDGILDILVSRDRIKSVLFLGQNEGQFNDGQEIGPIGPTRSVLISDMNNDGFKDFIYSLRGEKNQISFGPDHNTIKKFGFEAGTVRGKVADLNLDGHPDLVFANLTQDESFINLNDGNGNLESTLILSNKSKMAVDVAVGDLNGDHYPDLVFATIGQNIILLNDKKGNFNEVIEIGPNNERSYGVDIADLDNDGDLDIVMANDSQKNSIYININGDFKRLVLNEDPKARSYGVIIGDINNDGFKDIIFANSGNMNRVYLNSRQGNKEILLER